MSHPTPRLRRTTIVPPPLPAGFEGEVTSRIRPPGIKPVERPEVTANLRGSPQSAPFICSIRPQVGKDPFAGMSSRDRQMLQQAAGDQRALNSLGDYVRQAWEYVEPGVVLTENWHIDVICWELMLVYPGIRSTEPPLGWDLEVSNGADGSEILNFPTLKSVQRRALEHWAPGPEETRKRPVPRPAGGVARVDEDWRKRVPIDLRPPPLWRNSRLVINIPPGHMKSLLVGVFWPSWIWLKDPGHRLLSIAGSDTLAIRDGMKARSIISTTWYNRLKQRAILNVRRTVEEIAPKVSAGLRVEVGGRRVQGGAVTQVRRGLAGSLLGLLESTAEPWKIDTRKDSKSSYGTTQGGYREGKAIGSRIIGERGYGWTLDDPIDVKDVLEHGMVDHERISERCGQVNDIIDKTLMSRLNDKRPGRHYCVIIMQRLHIDDPAGALSRKGWRTVALRSRYIPDEDLQIDDPPNLPHDVRHKTHLAWEGAGKPIEREARKKLLYTKVGDLLSDQTGAPLFRVMYPEGVLKEIEEQELGDEQFNAQHQQSPLPGKGGVMNEALERARRYDADPFRIAAGSAGLITPSGAQVGRLEVIITVDATFGAKGATASNVAIEVWGRPWLSEVRAWQYALDCQAERMQYTETEDAVLAMKYKWPMARVVLIEKKANGAALLDRLKNLIPGLQDYDPQGSKTVRAAVLASCMKQGIVWLPTGDPRKAGVVSNPHTPWIDDFINELARFPGGRRDDRVDAASMAAIWFTEGLTPIDPQKRAQEKFEALRIIAADVNRGLPFAF